MPEVAVDARAERLRDYVYFDAISLLIGCLGAEGSNVLEDVVPQKYLGAGEIVSLASEAELDLWPDEDQHGQEQLHTDALSTVVAGEIFLALAASSSQLAEEGRRLVANGRSRLATMGDADDA